MQHVLCRGGRGQVWLLRQKEDRGKYILGQQFSHSGPRTTSSSTSRTCQRSTFLASTQIYWIKSSRWFWHMLSFGAPALKSYVPTHPVPTSLCREAIHHYNRWKDRSSQQLENSCWAQAHRGLVMQIWETDSLLGFCIKPIQRTCFLTGLWKMRCPVTALSPPCFRGLQQLNRWAGNWTWCPVNPWSAKARMLFVLLERFSSQLLSLPPHCKEKLSPQMSCWASELQSRCDCNSQVRDQQRWKVTATSMQPLNLLVLLLGVMKTNSIKKIFPQWSSSHFLLSHHPASMS